MFYGVSVQKHMQIKKNVSETGDVIAPWLQLLQPWPLKLYRAALLFSIIIMICILMWEDVCTSLQETQRTNKKQPFWSGFTGWTLIGMFLNLVFGKALDVKTGSHLSLPGLRTAQNHDTSTTVLHGGEEVFLLFKHWLF